ncbi:MAG: arylsulfatase [Planctomycetaceae bacterium]|nr:arylsulfatase [Planctomycetaceae bacterium]
MKLAGLKRCPDDAATSNPYGILMPVPRLFLVVCLMAAGLPMAVGQESRATPNIVFILGDDIGYGDFGCYGATKIKTPHVDRLAQQGVRLTDAHSPSAMCTPTRYAFMTGRYAWRQPAGSSVLSGIAPLCIMPGSPTVPSILKQAGYATGMVGKWHLGLGERETDYNRAIKPGPLEAGFDYAFILPATGDRVPCVFVENHSVVGYDAADPIRLDYTVRRGDPESVVAGIPRIGGMKGGQAALWSDADIADTFARKAVAFIEQHNSSPFFLYLATHDAHVPRVPHDRFRGSSQSGVRGDVIQEFDATVGSVLEALDRLQLTENTLVIVTSDNGGVLDPNGPDTVNAGTEKTNNGHLQNGALRGIKGNLFEGGHRVPFVARWPSRIKAGTTTDQLICHVDMLATFAAAAHQKLADDAGPDSFNVLSALLGTAEKPVRNHLINHTAGFPGRLAVRQGPWKYSPASYAGGKQRTNKDGQKAALIPAQLFNLADDLGEKKDVIGDHAEKVQELDALLKKIRTEPRSRP